MSDELIGQRAHEADTLNAMAGNRIREIRHKRRAEGPVPAAFTQEALAQRVGVTLNTLRRWESGAMQPRKRHAKALARALGVTTEELGLDPPPPNGR